MLGRDFTLADLQGRGFDAIYRGHRRAMGIRLGVDGRGSETHRYYTGL
jgi:hypothetical protein